ncbi:MAG: M23 family metallopeptidase [Clostridia bacterium]|nr:M23 family metallopeptidase [Clostridia bacterium]
MKVLQKPVFIGVGIFLAGILLTGVISRYYISRTNEISQNVLDTQQQSMKNMQEMLSVPEPEMHTVPVVEEVPEEPMPEETIAEAEADLFALCAPVAGDVMTAYTGERLVYSPVFADYRAHAGIDLYGAVGETVRACEKGEVHAIYADNMYGKTVEIKHENGFLTKYANLDAQVKVQVGETVEQGAVIGTVGETALVEAQSEPHLHFELYENEKAVNPEVYIEF